MGLGVGVILYTGAGKCHSCPGRDVCTGGIIYYHLIHLPCLFAPRRHCFFDLNKWTSDYFQLPNVNPETGEADKSVPFKVLMTFRTGLDPVHKRKPCVGCNAVSAEDGVVNVGDVVFVKRMVGEPVEEG